MSLYVSKCFLEELKKRTSFDYSIFFDKLEYDFDDDLVIKTYSRDFMDFDHPLSSLKSICLEFTTEHFLQDNYPGLQFSIYICLNYVGDPDYVGDSDSICLYDSVFTGEHSEFVEFSITTIIDIPELKTKFEIDNAGNDNPGSIYTYGENYKKIKHCKDFINEKFEEKEYSDVKRFIIHNIDLYT